MVIGKHHFTTRNMMMEHATKKYCSNKTATRTMKMDLGQHSFSPAMQA